MTLPAPAITGDAAAVGPAVAASSIPFKTVPSTDVGVFSGNWLVLVLLLAGMAAAALWVLRRTPGVPGGGRIVGPRIVKVLESVRLGDRTRVSVVRYRGRELLLAHGDQHVTLLSDQPSGSEVQEVRP